MSEHRKVRTSSRWTKNPRNTPRLPNTHLTEREQENRRIRRCQLLGEPSGAGFSPSIRTASDLLAYLQIFHEALERDGDCYDAWIGLSGIFAALQDHERVRHCRSVALRLQPETSSTAATLLH